MTLMANPPYLADVLLRLVLPRRDRDTVSGDLLEEYRETIVPAHGRKRADRWFVAQVAGILMARTWFLALLLSASSILRDAYDWFVPTTDFAARSGVTSVTSISILLLAGFIAAWRSDSLIAGGVAGAATALVASAFSIGGAAVLLAFFHDPATMAAIEGSGGLGEVFTMPLMIIVPGAILGFAGGAGAGAARMLTRSA